MISIFVGNTGQGKTYMCALTVLSLLSRNVHWFEKKKTTVRRRIATNIALNQQIFEKYKDYILYWNDLEQLTSLRECDIVFDDMGAYLDAQRWADLPMSVKRWLRLHEHYGCDIYGNAQDFLTIDTSVRRLTYDVTHVSKIVGSKRPSATKPKIKKVWGVLFCREVSEEVFDKEKIKYSYKGWPRIEFIKRSVCNVFDTTQDLTMGDYPPLHHIARTCPQCDKVVVKHA